MLEDYLTLRSVKLKRSEEWRAQGQGFSFALVKGGKAQYGSGSAAQNLQPGDLLILNSADGGTISGAGAEMMFLCFSACIEHLFPLFAVGEICLLQDVARNLKGTKLYPASSPLAKECHRLVESAPPKGNIDHRSHVLTIAAAVLSVELKNARSQRSGFVRIEEHMLQVFEELSATELLTLSVGDMAHKFSCSRRHLNRLFHQHFGCSVASLKMELRLLKALSLLRDHDAKIIAVAEQCGFNHLGLFNACFKKRFGNTPSQWRKGGAHGANGDSPVPHAKMGHPSCPMNAGGLCPWTPKSGECAEMSQNAALTQKPGRPGGPANPMLRDTILRSIREVSAPMKYKSSPGTISQNGH